MKKLKMVSTILIIAMIIGIMVPQRVEASNVYGGMDYSAVFDYEYYYNRYPDLQRAFGKNKAALLKHFVDCGMREGRQASEYFDVWYYRSLYPDLRNAFGNDLKQYYIHYINCGMKEGRIPSRFTTYKGKDYSDVFDYDYYYRKYPDLQRALGYNPRALIEHFVNCGMSEGRIAKDDFNIWYYKDKYPDLRKAFGNNLKQYYIHYIDCGKKERRSGVSDTYFEGKDYSRVYDKNFYYNAYPDLRKAFGNDARALIRHFVLCGMSEGRQGSANFNYHTYRNRYGDLQRAFGNDKKAYYIHYIDCGYNERRIATDSINGWVTANGNKMYFENDKSVTGWKLIGNRQYYFDSTGVLKSKTGIDVSDHNRQIDWQKVKNDGIEFAIIRIGYGNDDTSQDDDYAVYNMDQCEKYGIPYGVYIYSYALSEAEVDSEVAHTLRMLQGRNPSMGVYYDMEDADGYKQIHGMPSNDALKNFCIRFVRGINAHGYSAGIYASKYWFKDRLDCDIVDGYPKWLAQWASSPDYNKQYVMWQYTSSGTVDGIAGRVDMDAYLIQ